MRPSYSWGVLCGAYLAKALKIDRVSVVEFGVAGGNGLIALEKAAEQIEPILGLALMSMDSTPESGFPSQSIIEICRTSIRRQLSVWTKKNCECV